MNMFKQLARVRVAKWRMTVARHELGRPVNALLASAREHPLTSVGIASGTGFVLGSLNVHPLRVPGLASLLSGGMAGALSHGTQLLTELAVMGSAMHQRGDATNGSNGDAANDHERA